MSRIYGQLEAAFGKPLLLTQLPAPESQPEVRRCVCEALLVIFRFARQFVAASLSALQACG